jgi:hypothetical protein
MCRSFAADLYTAVGGRWSDFAAPFLMPMGESLMEGRFCFLGRPILPETRKENTPLWNLIG